MVNSIKIKINKLTKKFSQNMNTITNIVNTLKDLRIFLDSNAIVRSLSLLYLCY